VLAGPPPFDLGFLELHFGFKRWNQRFTVGFIRMAPRHAMIALGLKKKRAQNHQCALVALGLGRAGTQHLQDWSMPI
jgi:hypothetical protein